MPEISFYEQYEWSAARNAMKFWAVIDGDPIICWIDEEALKTFAQDEEEEKNVQSYFMENEEYIHEMAGRMILDKRISEDNTVLITVDMLSDTQEQASPPGE